MEVRDANSDDSATVLALIQHKAQFDRELGAFAGRVANSEALLCRHLFGPRPIAFVQLAMADREVVGFALYYFRYSSFRGRPSLWLDDLFVLPAARRQSAGLLLMRRLAALALAADCTHLAWIASASNLAGMSFYAKLGANIISQVDDTVTLQIEPERLLAAQ